jgi:hypothetical protein
MVLVLICYVAITGLASAMAIDDGWGLLNDPVRTFFAGLIGASSAIAIPMFITSNLGHFWGDVAFGLVTAIATTIIALHMLSPMIVKRSLAKTRSERLEREAEAERVRALLPTSFAAKWVPELLAEVEDAAATIDRFMERTSDTYDQAAMDARVLASHIPEIVRLTSDAMAKQDEQFRTGTARQAIDRIIAIGRATEKAASRLRTPEDDLLDARLRYVDERLDERLCVIG